MTDESQVDFSFGALAGGCSGRDVIGCLTEGDLLPGAVLAGVAAGRIGTSVGRQKANAGHFVAPASAPLLSVRLRAAVSHQTLLTLPLLVRHEGGELGPTLVTLGAVG